MGMRKVVTKGSNDAMQNIFRQRRQRTSARIRPLSFVMCLLATYISFVAVPIAQRALRKKRIYLDGGFVRDASLKNMLHKDDFILKRDFDASPIVVAKYKLIFFTVPKVGCTFWKQLFRKMEGYSDWNDAEKAHDPDLNGLVYLSDYFHGRVEGIGPRFAWDMLTSAEWKKAVFVRDPKERFLSAYLDKAVSNDGRHMRSCCEERLRRNDYERTHRMAFADAPQSEQLEFSTTDGCIRFAQSSLASFFRLVSETCPGDGHWSPQSRRVDDKHWNVLGPQLFVGHMESMEADAKRLLQLVGAWEEHGHSLFGRRATASHATHAKDQLTRYYAPDVERLVDEFYAVDYENGVLQLPKVPIRYDIR